MKNEKELLQECKLQLEYLNEKFGETGTTNALLTKLDAALRKPFVMESVCGHPHTIGSFFGGNRYIVKCKDCREEL